MCQSPALSAAIITENLGVNIFSSSQPLYMLPVPNCGEIIQPINTDISGCQPPSENTFYEWNGGWHWKVDIYGVYFWLASCVKWIYIQQFLSFYQNSDFSGF